MISKNNDDTAREKISEAATAQKFSFIVTGYSDAKDEILRLRNANRLIAQDGSYLDWRYKQLQGAPQPLVFWAVSESGLRVGMASLIFRKYWIDGIPTFHAVLGDISLDANMRGMGLGQRLLQYLTDYVTTNLPEITAFVIPNDAAQRSLNASGWKTLGSFVPFVFLLNPSDKLDRLLRIKWLANGFGWLFSILASLFLAPRVQKGCSIQLVDQLDESFEYFWQNYPKGHTIIRDRGVESVLWRFLSHPKHPIQIAKVDRAGEMLGFVAFNISQDDREVLIYDLVVTQVEDVGCVIALFVLKCRELGDICTIRMITSGSHPIGKSLSRLGFLRRESQTVFQIHPASGLAVDDNSVWALTWADKDI